MNMDNKNSPFIINILQMKVYTSVCPEQGTLNREQGKYNYNI